MAPRPPNDLRLVLSQRFLDLCRSVRVAAAILDRLLHHSHVVTIRGDSYRAVGKAPLSPVPPAGGRFLPGRHRRLLAAHACQGGL